MTRVLLDDVQPPLRKFACPYVKRFPHLEPKSHTCNHHFPRISRLKEHLFRCHQSDFHCERCDTKFEDKLSLEKHQKAQRACEPRQKSDSTEFTGSTSVELRKKSDAKKNDDGKWFDLFTILFPEVELKDIPSPDHDDRSLSSVWNPQNLLEDFTNQLLASTIPSQYHKVVNEILRACLGNMYYRGQHGPQNLSGIFLKEFPQTTTSEPTFYVGLPESGGSVPTIGSDFVAEQEYPEFRQPEYYSDANTYAIHDRWIQHGNNQFGVYTGATQEQLADPALQSYADPDWLPQQTAPFYAAVETWSEIAPNRYGGAPQSFEGAAALDQYEDTAMQDFTPDASAVDESGMQQYDYTYEL